MPDPLGDAEDEAELLTLDDGLTERDAEADTDDDGLGLRLTLGLALLIISRTANVTMARSSEVAFVPPTGRLPCPGVVSMKIQQHSAPISISGPAVLFAPAVGGVWWP